MQSNIIRLLRKVYQRSISFPFTYCRFRRFVFSWFVVILLPFEGRFVPCSREEASLGSMWVFWVTGRFFGEGKLAETSEGASGPEIDRRSEPASAPTFEGVSESQSRLEFSLEVTPLSPPTQQEERNPAENPQKRKSRQKVHIIQETCSPEE